MPEFDPINAEFDHSVDPLTADKHGLMILEKLEEGKAILEESDGNTQLKIKAAQAKLVENLSRYQGYKAERLEKLFSYEPEVRARDAAKNDEDLARSAIKLLQADDETFNTILEENGDADEFNKGQAFMQDKTTLRKSYSTKKLLAQSGYSDREIATGAAEPHMRTRLNAGEHESTRDAYLRWGLSKVNEVDRRRKITSAAAKEATFQFLGMQGDEKAFEEALANANPDISREERTHIRRIRNLQFQHMEEVFSQIKPLVRRTANTIMGEEGVATQFGEEGDAAFGSMEEAVEALSEIPREDFGKVVSMLAMTAEAHGQDVDGFFNKLGKNFGRAAAEVGVAAGQGIEGVFDNKGLKRAQEGEPVYRLSNKKTGEVYFYRNGEPSTHGRLSLKPEFEIGGIYTRPQGDRITVTEASAKAKALRKIEGDLAWEKVSKEEGIKVMQKPVMVNAMRSEMRNWREGLAKVQSDNMFVNDWVYGVARSLPEMGAAATGLPGIALIAAAQTEKNMAEIRRANPDADWEKHQPAAAVAGLGYSLLNRAQFTTLTKAMPKTRGFIAEFTRRLVIETVQESSQDLTLTASLELFGAIDSDIQDQELGKEVWDTIKRAPRTMFAVVPLVLAGTVGSAAVEYMGRTPMERVLRDKALMDAYGISEEHQKKIRSLPLKEALAYIEEHNEEFLKNVKEMPAPRLDSSVNITIGEDLNTFSVTDGTTTVEAHSSEEAAEAARQLNAKGFSVTGADPDLETFTQETEVEAEGVTEGVAPVEEAPAKPSKEGKALEKFAEDTGIDATSNIDDTSALKRRVKSALAKGYISKKEADEILRIQQESDASIRAEAKEFGLSKEDIELDTTDAYDELVQLLQARVEAYKAGEFLGAPSKVGSPMEGSKPTTPKQKVSSIKRKIITQGELAGLAAQAANPALVGSPEAVGAQPIRWVMPTDPVLQLDRPVSHPEITKALEAVLKAIGSKTPIRFSGRKVPKRASGVYYLNQKMIRVRKHNGVSTVAHEVAHAIEDQFLEGGFGDDKWVKVRKAVPAMAKELDKLGNDLYHGTAPANTTMSEGFAEYFRMLIEGHDMAKHVPLTHAWVQENILKDNPHIAKAVAHARDTAVKYAGQGSINRAKAGIVQKPGGFIRAKTDVVDFIKSLPDTFVDMLFPLKRIETQAEAELAKAREWVKGELARGEITKKQADKLLKKYAPLKSTQKPYETASERRMGHDSVVAYMINEGMRDFTGNTGGPLTSLKAATELVGERREEFAIYLWARRTLALDAGDKKAAAQAKAAGKKPKHPTPRETGLSLEDANKIFNELNSPAFETAAARVYDWQNGVLEYAAGSSADYAQVVADIRKVDPGNYIPLFREMDALDTAYRRVAPGAHGAKLVKSLKGSTRRIQNPFESMINQARDLVLRANQRAVVEQILNLIEVAPNMGHLMFEVKPDMIPAAHRSVVDMMDEVTKKLEDDPDLAEASQDLRDIVESSGMGDQMITLWGQAYMPPNGLDNPIIPIYRDGKRRWYEVNRTAYDALVGMDTTKRLNAFWDFTVAKPNRMFKLGTTGYRASFSMVTNPIRDVRTLMLNSQSSAMLPELLGVWVKTLGEGFFEALSGGMLVKSEWANLYRRLGLQMSTPLGEDTQHTKLAARKLFDRKAYLRETKITFKGKRLITIDGGAILEYVRDLFQYAEAATRITEMKLLAKEIGWNPKKDPLTPEIAQRLTLAAKRVTTDFTAAGSVMRGINQVLPFSNAQIQGPRAHIRALQANPAKFMFRGVQGTVAAIGAWLVYRDDDWWKDMPMKEKYGYTYIPIPAKFSPSGIDELLRIPRAFEADGLFMGFPVALLDALNAQNPDEATAWAEAFISSFQPSAPVTGSFLLEQHGKETYFERPIIPRGEERYDVEDFKHLQYGPHNTRLSIELGEMFDVSPRRIDHAIGKFTGGAGADLVALLGRGPADKEGGDRQGQLSDIPVLGTLFSSAGKQAYAPKPITELYDRYEYTGAHTGMLKLKGETETEAQRTQRLIVSDAVSMLSYLSEVEKLTLKTGERRAISAMKVEIARDAVKSFDSDTPNREDFDAWKEEVSVLRQKGNPED